MTHIEHDDTCFCRCRDCSRRRARTPQNWEFWDAARWTPDDGWQQADWAHAPLPWEQP
jgi:hypothetical protein